MDGLDDGEMMFFEKMVNGGGDEGVDVVEVDKIRFERVDDGCELAVESGVVEHAESDI